VMAPIEDAAAKARLWEILRIQRSDQRQAWDLQPDGSYVQRQPAPGATGPEALGTHAVLMQLARKSSQL
jgi:polyphosphate kinase